MRGVADPNLSLMAWRSAMIANSLLGKTAYEVEGENSALDFQET
jgi:lysine N6-hydroxylase